MHIAFVCHNNLEIKAALLAASIRNQCGFGVQLIAGVPSDPVYGGLSTEIKELFADLAVTTTPIAQPFGPQYRPANRIATLRHVGRTPALLLDSDVLCLRRPPLEQLVDVCDVAAKPADVLTFHPGDIGWHRVYDSEGIATATRHLLTTFSGELTLPYFNAGVIYTRDADALYGPWMALCQRLATSPAHRVCRSGQNDQTRFHDEPCFWLDQIALPLAIQRLGWAFRTLNESWNYPAHLRTLPREHSALPFLVHYHSLNVIAREPVLVERVRTLSRQYPRLEAVVARRDVHCLGSLLRRPIATRRPNCLITGIPRSGTSLLSRLMSDLPDSIVINEPPQSLAGRYRSRYGDFLMTLYADLRRDIVDGRPVINKLTNGRPTCDTFDSGMLSFHRPAVRSPNFVLGTKNTLVYLSRLGDLRSRLDGMPVVACVRDPRHVLSSWKRTFEHLRAADVASLTAQHVLASSDIAAQDRVQEINGVRDERVRRALLWRHLGLLLQSNRDWITIVRYEDLIDDAEQILTNVLSLVDVSRADERVSVRVPIRRVARPMNLDTAEERIIHDICSEQADCYGYCL